MKTQSKMNTETKPTTPSNFRLNKQGYVTGARCGVGHSGNHGLVRVISGRWECQGCGHIYTTQEVYARLNSPGGQIGQGGVVSSSL